jgi:hypothetical protein
MIFFASPSFPASNIRSRAALMRQLLTVIDFLAESKPISAVWSSRPPVLFLIRLKSLCPQNQVQAPLAWPKADSQGRLSLRFMVQGNL